MPAPALHLLHVGVGHFGAEVQADHHRLFVDGIGIEGQHRVGDVFPAKDEVLRLHGCHHDEKIA